MITIFKYPLSLHDTQTVKLPKGAEILTIDHQGTVADHQPKIALWAKVDSQEKETNEFIINIHGTGHNVHPGLMKYINTFQLMNGRLVYHAFVQLNKKPS